MRYQYITRGFQKLRNFSAFLLLGTVGALVWANVAPEGYEVFIHAPLLSAETLSEWSASGGLLAALGAAYEWAGGLFTHGHLEELNFHFFVNELFMVLFFGIAGAEVAESLLPGGALSSLRKAAMPVVATLGGVIGPVTVFLVLFVVLPVDASLINAWAVPAATDIAYAWLFARLIFGPVHPAVTFLLLLAVLDDMIGMLIIAVYYSSNVQIAWLGLLVLALIICEVMRRRGVTSYWPYVVIGGTLSWFGLHYTGVHAALALVPIVPFMPHSHRDAGLFAASEEEATDTMNRFEHFFGPLVDVGLFMFGLANAGVALTAESFTGAATWMIFSALLVGKTFGIFSFGWIGERFGLRLPEHMGRKELLVLGCIAGIGFTVALFVVAVTLQVAPGAPEVGDMLKLGALLSFVAGPLAWLLAKLLNVRRMTVSPARSDAEAIEPASDTAAAGAPAVP